MKEDRRYRLVLLAACLILFSFDLGGRDLWAPDEPRYAGVARAILESGDWIALTDNARPYLQKPPLFFWILAVTARLGSGVTELTARIPSGVFALLTVLLTYRLGRDLFGIRVGLFGGLVLATAQRFFVEARWVHIDMLLTFLILLALDACYRGLESGQRWRWAVAYVSAGLGCLAKGPVALAIPAAVVFTFLASGRELSRLRESGWFWGIPAALLPTLAWLYVFSREGGFSPVELVRTQVLERFQEGVHHSRPFYYYFYSLPLEFLPWTLFLPGALVVSFPSPLRASRKPLLFLYGWILGGLALLSLSAEKRPSYLLPLFPALALLVALLLESYLVRWDAAPLRKWIEAPLLLYAVACLAGVLLLPKRAAAYPGLPPRLVPLVLFYLGVCAAALTATRTGRRGAALLCLLGGWWAGYFWIAGSLLPWLNGYKSARPFSERIVARIGSAPLGIYGDNQPAYAFYTRRRLEVLRGAEELVDFFRDPRGGYCLLQKGDFENLRTRLEIEALDGAAVGHRTYVLVGSGRRDPGDPGS